MSLLVKNKLYTWSATTPKSNTTASINIISIYAEYNTTEIGKPTAIGYNLNIMNDLHTQLKTDLKESLKAKEATRLRTIRSLLTAITNELVAQGQTPQAMLDDDSVRKVIQKAAKQRKESIAQYESNDRPELAEPEKAELLILENYLPTMLSQAEIQPIAEAKQAELGITDKSKMGVLIGAVMKELSGQADGADVKMVVESLFN